jgi:myo-inositol 2-dehydrogenase / D-chiro-inositol 1-dehydrogenase
MPASRRTFLAGSTAALGALALSRSAHAAGSDVLKVGLIGCGGRGSGAASQSLRADSNVQLWAMGDAFEDRLQNSLKSLQTLEDVRAKIDVAPERQFVGFNAYQEVINSGVDVVLLTAPPHFRPLHLKAAIDAGKHVFAEKPVAVDAPGVRSVLETCRLAKEKNLSVVSGPLLALFQRLSGNHRPHSRWRHWRSARPTSE